MSASATSTTSASTSGSSTSAASSSSTSAASSTSTSAATSTSTTAAESTSTGCSFLNCIDQPQEPFACDPWKKDCPEGHKCMPYANDGGSAWNATKCSPVAREPDGVGEPCAAEESGLSGVDSCDATSMCFDVDVDLEGTCYAFCGGSPDAPTCDAGSFCWLTGDGVLTLCHPLCDPLVQDCNDGYSCLHQHYDVFACIVDASGDAGAFGDPCEYINACDPGLVCLNPEYVDGCQASGCCSPFCDTSAANTCPGDGQECIPWWEEGQAPAGYENVGVCGVPQ